MGTSVYQYCIVGLALGHDQVKTVISPLVTEVQNRYDTKTGKVIRKETVVVKEEVARYSIMGYENECPDALTQEINRLEGQIRCDYRPPMFYVGVPVLKTSRYEQFNLLCGAISLEELQEVFKKASEKLTNPKVILYSSVS